jgi:hypothetical protein
MKKTVKMKVNKLFLLVMLMGVLPWACTSQDQSGQESSQSETETGGEIFGESVEASGALSLGEFAEEYSGQDSARVKLSATVAEVCQKKGCWMNLTSGEKEKEIMVRFKDYGFFVPKDIAGRQVVVEGVARRELISVEDLRHYAADKGESEEAIQAITEPRENWTFTADGVLLLDK